MSFHLRFLSLAVVTLLGSGCGASSRPASIADWQSCIVAPGAIHGGVESVVDVIPTPGHAVWHAGAEWGRSAVRTEYQAGDLLVELPQELTRGTKLQINASTPALYREGGEAVSYQVEALEGTITVTTLTTDRATLEVDLRGTPTKDAAQRGPLTLKGTVTAHRRAQLADCR
ncbi:MAG: hypothetical protein U0271_20240 [Polyangiaceae bacterium]